MVNNLLHPSIGCGWNTGVFSFKVCAHVCVRACVCVCTGMVASTVQKSPPAKRAFLCEAGSSLHLSLESYLPQPIKCWPVI